MAPRRRRISAATAAVLEIFLAHPDRDFYGLEIIRAAGIGSGSLYPILHRLEEWDLLLASWERLEDAAARRTRPRRRYRLNPEKRERARDLHREWSTANPDRAPALEPGFAI
jgi:PadR family transcriptional regulator, regulatory protein PadR